MNTPSRFTPNARLATVPIPRSVDALTPEWATRALSRRHPCARVSSVQVVEVDQGTTTRVVVKLSYAAGSGPERIFVKLQGSIVHRLVISLLDVLYREARAFGAFDPMPHEAPAVYATTIDRRRMQSMIVMEDLRLHGATLNRATVALDADIVGRAMDSMGAMHARYWGCIAALNPEIGWVAPFYLPGWTIVGTVGTAKAQRNHREWLAEICPPDLWARKGFNNGFTHLWRQAIRNISSGPQTLVHGDAHVGNTYQLPDGGFGLLDWQCVARGSWAQDVGYFLISAMEIEERRRCERDLLERYLDSLAAAGAPAPSQREAWEAYRRAPSYGLSNWLTTLGVGDGYQQNDLATTTVKRFAAAYVDLDTAKALADVGL